MTPGFVAILTVELHFPEASSLKEKRHFVRSAKDSSNFGLNHALHHGSGGGAGAWSRDLFSSRVMQR